jgi:hypothetical protein
VRDLVNKITRAYDLQNRSGVTQRVIEGGERINKEGCRIKVMQSQEKKYFRNAWRPQKLIKLDLPRF